VGALLGRRLEAFASSQKATVVEHAAASVLIERGKKKDLERKYSFGIGLGVRRAVDQLEGRYAYVKSTPLVYTTNSGFWEFKNL